MQATGRPSGLVEAPSQGAGCRGRPSFLCGGCWASSWKLSCPGTETGAVLPQRFWDPRLISSGYLVCSSCDWCCLGSCVPVKKPSPHFLPQLRYLVPSLLTVVIVRTATSRRPFLSRFIQLWSTLLLCQGGGQKGTELAACRPPGSMLSTLPRILSHPQSNPKQ